LVVRLISISPTLTCFITRRVNRFVTMVKCFGREYPALNTNTGRLPGLLTPGRVAYCVRKRTGRLPLRLLGVNMSKGVALTDVFVQMRSFERAVELGAIPWLANCVIARRNPKVGESRLDYLIKCPSGDVWVELKSAVLVHGDNLAGYPDCPSLRGRKHIMELIKLCREGGIAMIIFIAALPGVKGFKPYEQGDPEISRLLKEALRFGVGIKALGISGIVKENSLITYLWSSDLPVYL